MPGQPGRKAFPEPGLRPARPAGSVQGRGPRQASWAQQAPTSHTGHRQQAHPKVISTFASLLQHLQPGDKVTSLLRMMITRQPSASRRLHAGTARPTPAKQDHRPLVYSEPGMPCRHPPSPHHSSPDPEPDTRQKCHRVRHTHCPFSEIPTKKH